MDEYYRATRISIFSGTGSLINIQIRVIAKIRNSTNFKYVQIFVYFVLFLILLIRICTDEEKRNLMDMCGEIIIIMQ